MEQSALFYEDIYDAARTDVQAIGGAKKVGHMLWPEKSVDKAGENLNNCLNVTRNEKLDLEQFTLIIREAKKVGSYATMYFMSRDLGFADPQPIEPVDEAAALQRDFIQSVKAQGEMLKRLESLSIPTVKAVG